MAKIALSLIDPPKWDSRLPKTGKAAKDEFDEIAKLRVSMDTQGQITPIEVEQADNGRYIRVFGGRRMAAASLTPPWEAIEATVRPASHGNEAMIRNIVENEKRLNLTTYETARACASMRDAGLTDDDVATLLGKAKTHVRNMARAFKVLPDPVKEDWRMEHPAASTVVLFAISSDKEYPTPEKKQEAWDERVREYAKREGKRADAGKERDEKGGASAGYPVSQKRFTHVYESLTAKGAPDLDPEQRKFLRAVLDFIIQARETPPTGVPPLPVKVKAEKPTKGDKVKETEASAE